MRFQCGLLIQEIGRIFVALDMLGHLMLALLDLLRALSISVVLVRDAQLSDFGNLAESCCLVIQLVTGA